MVAARWMLVSVVCVAGVCGSARGQLVAGVNEEDVFVQVRDVIRGTYGDLFQPTDSPAIAGGVNPTDGPNGMAADDAGGVLYWCAGDNLYQATYGDVDANGFLINIKVADMSNPESGTLSQAFSGLAFANGVLYGSDTTFTPEFPTPEGIYEINATNGETTLVVDLTSMSDVLDFGGIAFNPADQVFYGTSDDPDNVNGPGLYAIDVLGVNGVVGAVAFVTSYPAVAGAGTDIDGLAIGDGKAYFVIDQPGEIGVWDFVLRGFEAPIASPWVVAESVSAGAWAPGLVSVPLDNDLSIEMTASPALLPEIGGTITFTVTVTNDSQVATDSVTVLTTLDPTLTFTGTTGGGVFGGNVLSTMLGTMAPLSSVSFDVTAVSTVEGTTVTTSSVAGAQVDPQGGNDSASSTVVVSLDADVRVGLLGTPNPVVGLGSSDVTYTVTVANAGPLAAEGVLATFTLPANVTFVSSTMGGLNGGGSAVEVTLPSLAADDEVRFDVTVTPGGLGVFLGTADVEITSGVSSDPEPGDNVQDFTVRVVDALATPAPEVIFSTVQSSATSDVPGLAGEKFAVLGRAYRSPDGLRWIMTGLTADPDLTIDEVLVTGMGTSGTVMVQEGVTLLPGLSDAVGAIDVFVSINDSGDFAFCAQSSAPAGSDEVVVKWDGVSLSVVARSGEGLLPMPAVLLSDPIAYANILNDGTVAFVTDTDAPGVEDGYVLRDDGATVVVHEGETVPLNQAGGLMEAWDFFPSIGADTDPFDNFQMDGAGANWMLRGDTESADTATDNIAVLNNTVFVQEGQAIAGLGSTVAPGGSTLRHYLGRSGGHFIARGIASDGRDWVLRDGVLIAATGDEIVAGSGERWSDAGPAAFGPTFMAGVVDSGGRYVLGGFTDTSDALQDNVLVLDGETVLSRDGTPIDLDGNGVFDDDLFISFFGADDMFMGEAGHLYFNATLRNGLGFNVGEAFMRLPLPDAGCFCELSEPELGVTDVFDLLVYLDFWFAETAGAECDGVAGVSVFDLICFLECWFVASSGGGCG